MRYARNKLNLFFHLIYSFAIDMDQWVIRVAQKETAAKKRNTRWCRSSRCPALFVERGNIGLRERERERERKRDRETDLIRARRDKLNLVKVRSTVPVILSIYFFFLQHCTQWHRARFGYLVWLFPWSRSGPTRAAVVSPSFTGLLLGYEAYHYATIGQ